MYCKSSWFSNPFIQLLLSMALFLVLLAGCQSVTDDDFNPNDPFAGAEANMNTWRWIPVDGMRCRDGSETGIGIRLRENATGLVIYMEGGGACFNETTCNGNPKAVGSGLFGIWANSTGKKGIFNIENNANPVGQWHMVYVPYCTGDIHAGDNSEDPPYPNEKNFMGHQNMAFVLDLIAPYFSNVDQVLLCGSSAGGFGATMNYVQTEAAFGSIPVSLINDSGPYLEDDAALAPCLQQVFRDAFNLAATLPQDCAACVTPNGDGLAQIYAYLGATYAGNMGLICYQTDEVIRKFYNFGTDDCANLDGAFSPYEASVFETGLEQLRDDILIPGGWSTFYPSGSEHTTLGSNKFYNLSIQGTSLAQWVDSLLDGEEMQLEE